MFAGALLGISMLLLLRRYTGINHDSILYLGQGLMQRWPEIYGQDLFFVHGSQANYTVLPWLLGQAFGWLTPPETFIWGTLFSMLLFSGASWFVVSGLLPERQRYWAWLGTLCLPPIYGIVHIFSYNEPFLTSRPLAEGFSLLCIGMLVRNRWALALASLVLAGLFHPLQTIGTFIVIWIWAVARDRRWLHALWLSIPLSMLAFAGIAPFDGLFLQADPAWLTELKYSRHMFMTLWAMNDFKALGFDIFVLLCCHRVLRGALGDWCLAAVIGLLLGDLASLILVDGLHLILPTGLQLWRVQWVAHWFSMAAFAALLFRHIQEKQQIPVLLLSLTALLAWGETDWGWLLLASMYIGWPRLPEASRMHLKRLLIWIFAIAILLLFASHAANETHWFRVAHYRLDVHPIDRRLLAFPVVSLGLPLLGVLAWKRTGKTGRRFLFLLLLCPLVLLSACMWDSRNDIRRVFESTPYRPDIFGPTIPLAAQVYWEPESLVATWLTLHRATYYSDAQLSGQMFNRATFSDGLARQNRMLPLTLEARRCSEAAKQTDQDPTQTCRISEENMRKACSPGHDQNRSPDYIVLPYEQPQRHAGEWTLHDPGNHRKIARYWLYECKSVMNDL